MSSLASSADAALVVFNRPSQTHTETGGKVVSSHDGAVTSPSPVQGTHCFNEANVGVFRPFVAFMLVVHVTFSHQRTQNPNDSITFPGSRAHQRSPVTAQATFDKYQDTRNTAISRYASPPPGYSLFFFLVQGSGPFGG